MVARVVCRGLVIAPIAVDLRVEVVTSSKRARGVARPLVHVAHHVEDLERVRALRV